MARILSRQVSSSIAAHRFRQALSCNAVRLLHKSRAAMSVTSSNLFKSSSSRFHFHSLYPPVFQSYSTSSHCKSSPFDSSTTTSESAARKKLKQFVPRKAAVEMTENARNFFTKLLESPPRPEIIGILLNYDQSSSGEPRMVFSFKFITAEEIGDAEGVSLEIDQDGKPKPPSQAMNDGLPKVYVHPNAFLKVLGATVDVDPAKGSPILLDREGNKMDPNDT